MIEDKSKTLPKVKDTGPTMDRVDPDKVAKALGATASAPTKGPHGPWPIVIHRKRRKSKEER